MASCSDAAGVEKSLGEDFWKPPRWTCAHRYALFTLAGIAAEDDLDAPDPGSNPRADPNSPYVNGSGPPENPTSPSRIIEQGGASTWRRAGQGENRPPRKIPFGRRRVGRATRSPDRRTG
jgi:hypothetical protein